jgi:hypothetical protein
MKKKLIGLALFAGAVAVAAKVLAAKKSEWQGLSETEVRQKVETRIPSRVSDEKRVALADRVVAKMRERGVLGEETRLVSVADAEEDAGGDMPHGDDATPEPAPTDQID